MQLQRRAPTAHRQPRAPSGDLKITTPPALGINWLIPRSTSSPHSTPPTSRISLIVTGRDLDLSMREADVADPDPQATQPDLIQRNGSRSASMPIARRNTSSASARPDLDASIRTAYHAGRFPGARIWRNRSLLIDAGATARGRASLLQGQQHLRAGPRLPAGARHRRPARLPGRGEQPPGQLFAKPTRFK